MGDRIYPKLVAARLRGQMSYRVSFALECLGQAFAQAIELVVILVVFSRVDALGGFSASEVVLLYAFAGTAFGIADLVAGQLNELPDYIRTGKFDVLLLRPLGTLPQVMASDVRLRRAGRVAAGIITMAFALTHNDIAWSPWTVLLVVVTPLAGAVIFSAVWIVACAVSFWLVEAQELANAVTHGSNSFTSYPITVYSGWLRRFMAFVVPGAFVAYYPGLALLGRADPLGGPAFLGWIAPLVALAAACVAGLVWRFAVRHYRGTGS
ncbi:ABC-2 type transport system permease protein [Saccharothrix tamanrassetensis]|uniref:ABC-2 type transport system permease protein n=1 Tax=Saccharothrix tamanrassetensis TaxID=1051531 RepID=A0A841C8X1_9PSEU|nr:ABC-2 family transporter protein [Saccharothrix tamanrassetensis]MBB5954992.1 ABC-2 type transport system permease protein [Saccharothrix tamanrassetensis]